MDKFLMMALVIILIAMAFLFSKKTRIDSVIDGSIAIKDSSLEKIPLEKLIKGPYFLPHDHPYLIKHIRKSLLPPSVLKGYKMHNPTVLDPARGCQTKAIRNILGEMKYGFFVEAGALDGEFYSNTLVFERDYKWTGLLVEPNPVNWRDLIKMQRKAWAINSCLSTTPYPFTASFFQHKRAGEHKAYAGQGKIVDVAPEASKRYIKVQCIPLYSILMALNKTTIDYISLDIQGSELAVLKTIPWDKINIKTLTVEFVEIPGGKNALRKYMESVGYVTYAETGSKYNKAVDTIFHRKDVVPVIKAAKNPMLC